MIDIPTNMLKIIFTLLLLLTYLFVVNPTLVIAADGSWSSGGNMITKRISHTATLLNDGQILVVGGRATSNNSGEPSGYLSSSELYNPITNTWSQTANIHISREGHTATKLPNGKVLIVGGYNSTVLNDCEIYDPTSGNWTNTGSLNEARTSHTATLLPNGEVLVTGGDNLNGVLAGAEIYNPNTGAWRIVQSMSTTRTVHSAVLLNDNKVLVVGGQDRFSNVLDSAEIFDISTETWASTQSMLTSRSAFQAKMLSNGKVLVFGGFSQGNSSSTSEIFDQSTETWSSTGNMVAKRARGAASILQNGDILITGGISDVTSGATIQSSAEMYNVSLGTWNSIPAMLNKRYFAEATLLANGKVLVTGGSTLESPDTALAGALLYTPETANPTPTPTPSPILTPTPPSTGGVLNVPLFKQGLKPYNDNNPTWENDIFDHAAGQFTCGTTMAQCGCSTTSIAMVFKAHGIEKMPDGQPLTPGTLNTWLKNNNGYNRNSGVDWAKAATLTKLAKGQNPNFHYDALEYKRGGVNKAQLRSDINIGIPNILEVPGHFIVATNIDGDTFTINDPYYNRTSLASYSNTYNSVRRYIPSHTDLSYITIVADKDVDISLRDSSGSSVGESYIDYEINDATLEKETTQVLPSLKILTFAQPHSDSYQIEVSSQTIKNFQLDIKLLDMEGDDSVKTFKGVVSPDASSTFTLNYNQQSAASSAVDPEITFDKLKADIKTLYLQGKIKNKVVYATLLVAAEVAERATLINRQPLGNKLAVVALKAFQLELNKVRGKSVTEDGYQILYQDSQALINELR